MIDLFIMYGGIIFLALVIAGCSRLQSHNHDDKGIKMVVTSTDDECKAEFAIERLEGSAGDDMKVDNPLDGVR